MYLLHTDASLPLFPPPFPSRNKHAHTVSRSVELPPFAVHPRSCWAGLSVPSSLDLLGKGRCPGYSWVLCLRTHRRDDDLGFRSKSLGPACSL